MIHKKCLCVWVVFAKVIINHLLLLFLIRNYSSVFYLINSKDNQLEVVFFFNNMKQKKMEGFELISV